ncbi:MAG: DUF3817 domain-containing protein [Micrococcaceae bacterium]
MFRTPHTLFRTLAIAEACSWTLLIAGLILRAAVGWDLAVTLGGGIHGFVFLSYATTAVLVSKNQRWRPTVAVVAIGSAVVPYATVPMERWLARRGHLDGAWRRTPTDDVRDRAWHDRLMRVVLNHPMLSGAVALLAVVVAYLVLLQLGSPLDAVRGEG